MTPTPHDHASAQWIELVPTCDIGWLCHPSLRFCYDKRSFRSPESCNLYES